MRKAGGRYLVFDEIASGGMATVHFGRLDGPAGFSRTVAIKCLHPHLAKEPKFVEMFLDEARIASRIRHPNVVPVLDVVADAHELFLVMEYVDGESLARLIQASVASGCIETSIAVTIMIDVLHGLHAAHETTDASGKALDIVHRDVSPQNIIVGADGVSRVLDFGVARALNRVTTTRDGELKGKIAYMSPEQLEGKKVSRQTDIYAASVVLWETLTRRRLFSAEERARTMMLILAGDIPPPSSVSRGIVPALDAAVMRGLSVDPSLRFGSAREMADALRAAAPLASPSEVGRWVESLASESLAARRARMSAIESAVTNDAPGDGTDDNASRASANRGREPGQPTGSMVLDPAPAPAEKEQAPPRDEHASAPPHTAPPPPRKGRALPLLAIGAIGAACVGVVGTIVVIVGGRAERSQEARPEPSLTTSVAEPEPGQELDASPTVAGEAPPSAPTVSASTARPPEVKSAAADAGVARRPPPPVVRRPNCNPPYREIVVNNHVRRVPKPECL